MATKICIIEVDLGLTVDAIIGKEVEAIAGAAEKELDLAIESAKAVQRVKEDKANAVAAADQKLADGMENAYKHLVDAGIGGMPVSSVMTLVSGLVPNSSAFTLRMKAILAQKGSPYYLERQKVHGTPHYVLVPFNQPTEHPEPEQP